MRPCIIPRRYNTYNTTSFFGFSGLVPKSIYDDAIENRGSGRG